MRVSTAAQKPDLQLDNLRAYADRAKLVITDEYLDLAISGKAQARPPLSKLMLASRDHKYDCVPDWKFDRFARSPKHLPSALEEFNYLDIRFVSVQD